MPTVLFATDGSPGAAVAQALLNALPLPAGTRIRVVTVAAPFDDSYYERHPALRRVWEERHREATGVLESAVAGLARSDREVSSAVRTGEAAHEILAAAQQAEADLVVVGACGHSAGPFALGAVARNVAGHASCPVLAARPPARPPAEIVLAADGSEHSGRAVEFLLQLRPPAARVTVVSVVRPHRPLPLEGMPGGEAMLEIDRLERAAAQSLASGVQARLAEGGIQAEARVRSGDPAQEVLAATAERGAELVVAGARGVSFIEGLLMGSVADRLLRRAPCSVLLVR